MPSGLCVGSLSDLITLGVFVVRLVTLVEAVEASVLIVSRVACKVLWVPLIVIFISVFKVLKPGSNFISSDSCVITAPTSAAVLADVPVSLLNGPASSFWFTWRIQ